MLERSESSVRIETPSSVSVYATGEHRLERSESSVRIETLENILYSLCIARVRTIGILSEDWDKIRPESTCWPLWLERSESSVRIETFYNYIISFYDNMPVRTIGILSEDWDGQQVCWRPEIVVLLERSESSVRIETITIGGIQSLPSVVRTIGILSEDWDTWKHSPLFRWF